MPGVTRYWTPFYGTTNVEIVNARYKYMQKPNCLVIDQMWEDCLAFMNPAETFLINGHGSYQGLMISETSDGTGWRCEVQEIANCLYTAGLPKDHVRIKMLGCMTEFFARFLAITLGKTHPNIVVGGYTRDIYIGNGHRALISQPGRYAAPNVTGSGFVVWHNANGSAVVKPAAKLQEMDYDPVFPE